MNKKELKETLTELKIEFEEDATNDELEALLSSKEVKEEKVKETPVVEKGETPVVEELKDIPSEINSMTKEKMKKIIDTYKTQNPKKYKEKKERLEAKLNSL